MMMTMMVMTPVADHLFAVAAIEIAFATAFGTASLLPKLSYVLVYASIRHMDLGRPDADKTHVYAMHLCCVKRANKHYTRTYIFEQYHVK